MNDRNSIKEHAKPDNYAILCPKSGFTSRHGKIPPSSIIVNGWMQSDLILSGYTRNHVLLVLTFKIETKYRNHYVVIFCRIYVVFSRKEMAHKKSCYRKQGAGKTKLTSVPAALQDPWFCTPLLPPSVINQSRRQKKGTKISAGTAELERIKNTNAQRILPPTGIDSRTPATLGLAALPSTKSRNCATPTTL